MSGETVILVSDRQRAFAKRLIDGALPDSVVTIREPGRTLDQNAMMWAMLSDISRAQPGGRVGTPDTWKGLVMHACGFAVQFEIGLNGQPFPTGYKTSRLSKREMSMLIEWMFAYGAEHGICWTSPAAPAEAGAA